MKNNNNSIYLLRRQDQSKKLLYYIDLGIFCAIAIVFFIIGLNQAFYIILRVLIVIIAIFNIPFLLLHYHFLKFSVNSLNHTLYIVRILWKLPVQRYKIDLKEIKCFARASEIFSSNGVFRSIPVVKLFRKSGKEIRITGYNDQDRITDIIRDLNALLSPYIEEIEENSKIISNKNFEEEKYQFDKFDKKLSKTIIITIIVIIIYVLIMIMIL